MLSNISYINVNTRVFNNWSCDIFMFSTNHPVSWPLFAPNLFKAISSPQIAQEESVLPGMVIQICTQGTFIGEGGHWLHSGWLWGDVYWGSSAHQRDSYVWPMWAGKGGGKQIFCRMFFFFCHVFGQYCKMKRQRICDISAMTIYI